MEEGLLRELKLFQATPHDYESYLSFYGELGLPMNPLKKEQWLTDLAPHSFFLMKGSLKAGYAYVEVLGTAGYFRHVVVDKDHRKQGIGKVLMLAVGDFLKAKGCTEWCLNCFRDNTSALSLYRSVGMQIVYPSAKYLLPWSGMEALPSLNLENLTVVHPMEDSVIESKFGLLSGQVARFRSLKGSQLLKLETGEKKEGLSVNDLASPDRLLGFLCFQSIQNYCNPFKAVSEAAAKELLLCLRQKIVPETRDISLMVEDNQELENMLVVLGARAVMESYHLRGAIPNA